MADTNLVLATFDIIQVTYDSVVIRITAGSGYTRMRVYLREDPDPGSSVYNKSETMASKSVTIGGLTPETDYAVNVCSIIPNETSAWVGTQYFTTPSKPKPRPAKWSWRSTVAAGEPISISASEWNDFCSNINSMRDYKGLSSYSFSSVQGGTTISASIVNQAVTAIAAMKSTANNYEVNPGDPITAVFFNDLADILNSIS